MINSHVCEIHVYTSQQTGTTDQIDNVDKEVLTYSQFLLCWLYIYVFLSVNIRNSYAYGGLFK